ncbi:MAPEG family protein [Brevundimonas sp. AJA228-03]|uniref:MAPEG family protein n=1 Tax=Brevundimonas sp. AJA228-03 TaxID=2752515 RepID=UPI001ADF45E9|nr:MAPEG family protein [Brevundimonas sp. AJA228-03]QTN20814.1 MAPEG family protein [Brevundimonas sp. AJA228-03]
MGDAWVLVTTPELTMLAATLVLAFVLIFLPAAGRTMAIGLLWNAGPRDGVPTRPGLITRRLERAQANMWETLPLFIGAVLIAHVTGEDGPLTFWGTQAFFWARLVYIPIYAFGVPFVRSLVWLIAMGGLVAIFVALFT